MTTAAENELITRVGPDTPGGALLRRYWHPVAMLPDLSPDSPTRHVRILGEDLVLFRDTSGNVGLLADHCAHRGASLLYGRVEERGIACAYHGWLYDTKGDCLECPAEPAGSKFHMTVKVRAYPVRERYGMYWAYLGSLPAPVLPRYDFAELGPLSVGLSYQDCNWLQVVENNLDQSHTVILHQATRQRGVAGSNTARGLIHELESLEYSEAPFGIKRHRVDRSGYDDTDLMIFPASARIYNHMSIKVPIDDTHTMRFTVFAELFHDGVQSTPAGNGARFPVAYADERELGKSPAAVIHPYTTYRMDKLPFQDLMALETQGAIAPRENERLSTADRGVVLLRDLMLREIGRVQQGQDPIGVIRDPDSEFIDTYISVYIEMFQRFPPDKTRAQSR
jgi:5,5'-dehydrodivanillate O-demethylase oxygenase subunit